MAQTNPFDREVCRPFFHQGSEDGILLMHGFTGSAAHMRKIADRPAELGYTVMTINLPGHATSEAEMAKCTWKDWLEAAKQAVLELKTHCKRVTVCGLSMGGVLALLVAEQMQVDGCVPISAPMAVKNRLLGLAGIAAPLLPRIAWGGGGEYHKGLDKAYDFGYSGFPTAKGADLHKLIKLARKNLFSVVCPILCVQSQHDETIWEGSADCILENVSSERRQKLWLTGVPHVCTISPELPAIADSIDHLLQQIAQKG
jgi:carboxylesterase